MSTPLVIVDYGLGNLFSLQIAMKSIGYESKISSDKKVLDSAERIILPGVGAFGAGMRNLEKDALSCVIKNYAERGLPILGICLGMQLLMESSEEEKGIDGLSLVDGEVKKLNQIDNIEHMLKIPQVGWNKINFSKQRTSWKNTILDGLEENSFFYFVHSYAAQTKKLENSLAITQYGITEFSSVVTKGNISGTQFHPELSGPQGLKILKNFMNI